MIATWPGNEEQQRLLWGSSHGHPLQWIICFLWQWIIRQQQVNHSKSQMLEDDCVTEELIFGRNEKSCSFLSMGVEVFKLLQLNKEKVWHKNAFLADLVPLTPWIQSFKLKLWAFEGN